MDKQETQNVVSARVNTSAILRGNLRMFTMVFVLIGVIIFFQFVVPDGIFLGSRNLSNLFRQFSITGVITVGMMLLIVSANFDLAVGSIVALVSGFVAMLQVHYGVATSAAIPLGLALGVGLGVWQGYWVAYRRVPSFIVSLGNMGIFRGIFLTLTKGITISPMQTTFVALMTAYVAKSISVVIGVIACVAVILLVIMQRRSAKRYNLTVEQTWVSALKIGLGCALIIVFIYIMNAFEGIPVSVMILIVVAILFAFIATKTRFARRVYAIGGNPEAAKLAGINVKQHIMALFIITGILSALSGILLTARLNAAVAAAGKSYELEVISAVVVGGTSLSGGKGTVPGVIIGALLISVLGNGMSLLNIDSYVQDIVKGMVLILAVWFDVATQTKSK